MKTRVQIALVGTLLSVLGHLYLTLHYYPIKLGVAGAQSLCNINEKFNCDAVAASPFSSLFGIPLSAFGLITNLILFLVIAVAWLEWSETPERLRRWALALAGVSVAASVVMGVISLAYMQNYCLFCIGLYVLSVVVFFAYTKVPRELVLPGLARDGRELVTEGWPVGLVAALGALAIFAASRIGAPAVATNILRAGTVIGMVLLIFKLRPEVRGITAMLLGVPAGALFTHQMFMLNMGDARLNEAVAESIELWESSKKNEFVAKPTLAKGPEAQAAAITFVEFADFRCGHCRHASHSLHAFTSAHPDVRFEFYSFPLDGACNEKINGADGISCRLAAAVLCGEKEGRGWQVHDLLFARQDQTVRTSSPAELDIILSKDLADMGLNWESFKHCMDDAATLDAIKAQAKQGALVGVNGTPSIFADGKPLKHGQIIPVLQAARQRALDLKAR